MVKLKVGFVSGGRKKMEIVVEKMLQVIKSGDAMSGVSPRHAATFGGLTAWRSVVNIWSFKGVVALRGNGPPSSPRGVVR